MNDKDFFYLQFAYWVIIYGVPSKLDAFFEKNYLLSISTNYVSYFKELVKLNSHAYSAEQKLQSRIVD